MVNLRLLKIRNVQLPKGLVYLPKNLRLLDWEGYPLKSLPPNLQGYPLKSLPPNLQLDKIVELKMDKSRIQQLQRGIKPFNNLKSINFSNCQYLIRTPDFKFAPNLEELFLNECKMLREIHPSLLVHKKITHLNMRLCTSLTTLPNQMHMKSLEFLDLSFCYKLEKFPKIIGSMDCLLFNLENCKNLVSLPVTGLKRLAYLELSGCSKLHNLPEFLGQVEKPRTLQESGTAIRQPMASIFLKKNLERLVFRGCEGPPSKSLSSLCLKTSRLPTFSGLYRSLGTLSLADCNMEEGAIPNDFFSSFSSLWRLDLRKNNFVSLPGSIKHLSQLKDLCLHGCKRLRSLPELPSNIDYINVNGCVALETASNALRLCNSKLSGISCVNCLKLFCCNNLASSMPREFPKAMSKPHKLGMLRQGIAEFEMVIPGSEIPEWFQHQSETSSIKIERPPDYCDNKMMGYAVFCVFDVREHRPTTRDSIYCAMTNIRTFVSPSIYFEENLEALSDHLWLLYFSAERLSQDFVELSFGTRGPRVEVKKCGIHPVYEKEIEELKPRAKKCSSSCFWNSYELDEDFLGSTVDVDSDGAEDKDEYIFQLMMNPDLKD